MKKLAEILRNNGFEITVGIYGQKYKKKDVLNIDEVAYEGVVPIDFTNLSPDQISGKYSKYQAVIFDGCDAESIYSKSFYYNANSVVQILDIFELEGNRNARKEAFTNTCELTEIAKKHGDQDVFFISNSQLLFYLNWQVL